MKNIIAAAFFTIILSPPANNISPGNWVQQELEKLGSKYSPPALTAAVVSQNEIFESACLGVRKLGRPDSVKIDDQFHIGSITKSMTSYLAALLVNEGVINWDTKLVDLYPELADNINLKCEDISFSDLLLHRGGLPGFTLASDWDDVPVFKCSLPDRRREFTVWLLSSSTCHNYGEFSYSNAGYAVAASMMEILTNSSWEELIVEYVFQPLELNSAGFGNPALEDTAKVWGHWQQWIGRTPTVPVYPFEHGLNPIDAPAGDVHMSILDLAKYAQFHLRGIRSSESEIVKDIHFSDDHYSYGWFVRKINGHNVSIHWGSPATFIAGIMISRDLNLAAVVMSNSSDNDSKAACRQFFEDVLDNYAN